MRRRCPALLIIDNRERLPYIFAGCSSGHVDFTFRPKALAAGDYAAQLHEDDAPDRICVIERKSLADLFQTLTRGRERFERELERLRPYGFRAIVVEGDLSAIVRGLPGSRANPGSIVGSLIALSQRYGVHVVFASNRQLGELYTYRLLERWVRDLSQNSEVAA